MHLELESQDQRRATVHSVNATSGSGDGLPPTITVGGAENEGDRPMSLEERMMILWRDKRDGKSDLEAEETAWHQLAEDFPGDADAAKRVRVTLNSDYYLGTPNFRFIEQGLALNTLPPSLHLSSEARDLLDAWYTRFTQRVFSTSVLAFDALKLAHEVTSVVEDPIEIIQGKHVMRAMMNYANAHPLPPHPELSM